MTGGFSIGNEHSFNEHTNNGSCPDNWKFYPMLDP